MLNFLQKVPLFSQLNDVQIETIASVCIKKTYKAGTVLFQQNEIGSIFYIIHLGTVKIFTSHAGEEKILQMFKSGDSFGELSLIDGKPRSASAQTLEDCMMIMLSAQNFLQICAQNFEINLCIMRELCQRLRDTTQHVNDLTFLDARTRIIKNLIQLANKHGLREGHFIHLRIQLNYDELAQMSNVTKQVLMQVMRDMQEKQIVTYTANDLRIDLTKLR